MAWGYPPLGHSCDFATLKQEIVNSTSNNLIILIAFFKHIMHAYPGIMMRPKSREMWSKYAAYTAVGEAEVWALEL